MKSKTVTLITITSLLLVLLLALAACQYVPGAPGQRPKSGIDPAQERYFTGTEGVVTRFDSFPSTLYYYDEPGSAYNEFEVSVEVRNEGASFTRGGIYLSGYDPNMIKFEEIPITGSALGSCGISVGSLGLGNIGGIFQCDGFSVGAGEGGAFTFGINSMQQFVQGLGEKFGKSWWDESKFDFSMSANSMGDFWDFSLGLNDPNFDMEYMGHGRLFLALFSGIDFERTLGQEYFLAGDTYEYPGGELAYITYRGVIDQRGWPPGLDQVKQSILMTNCYFYTTYAAPLVCIDTDPQSQNAKVCYPEQHSWSGSQGAPVAITSIEQENTPRKAVFRINIQNVGHGEVFDPGKLEKCSPYLSDRVRTEDKNIVYLGDIRIGSMRLRDCVPDGIVRLQNGRGTITCTYPFEFAGLKSAYETPLVVELWYGYSETQRRDIMIKRMS